MASLTGNIIWRYTSLDDKVMFDDISIGDVVIPLKIEDYAELSHLLKITEGPPDKIYRDISSNFPFVKNKTKLIKDRGKKIESVFPIVELIRNYQYNLLFKFTIKNFNILVPHLDRQSFTTTGDYLDDTNAYDRHYLYDGIYGFLTWNNGEANFYYSSIKESHGKVKQDWGFSNGRYKGIFISYNSPENFSTPPQNLPIGEQGKNAVAVGTMFDHEMVSEAVSAKAPLFDEFRIHKSNELESTLPELSENIKSLQKPPEGDKGDAKIKTLKGIFDLMKGKIKNEIFYSELGKLLPTPNTQEINYTGFGFIKGMYFDLENDKPINIPNTDKIKYIEKYLSQFGPIDYSEVEEINRIIEDFFNKELSNFFASDKDNYYKILINYYKDNHIRLGFKRRTRKKTRRKSRKKTKRKSRKKTRRKSRK